MEDKNIIDKKNKGNIIYNNFFDIKYEFLKKKKKKEKIDSVDCDKYIECLKNVCGDEIYNNIFVIVYFL
jgi:hypothetical protein